MPNTQPPTNLLVDKLKLYTTRFVAPAGAAALLLFGGCFLANHVGVHAASNPAAASYAGAAGAAPLDNNSVSSLVALDHAVEAVAQRVTPAVVNIAVTVEVEHSCDELFIFQSIFDYPLLETDEQHMLQLNWTPNTKHGCC